MGAVLFGISRWIILRNLFVPTASKGMKMDRRPKGMISSKSDSNPKTLSAFEMSISQEYQSLEFQANPPSQGKANLKVGDLCPHCQSAELDYDGMLNLHCQECGYTLAGCFT